METQQLDVVAVSQEEIGAEIGISGDAVGVLLARATDAACIDATMSAHYSGDAPMDDITIDGLAGVLDKFRHVITQYRIALVAAKSSKSQMEELVANTQSASATFKEATAVATQQRDQLQKQLDEIAAEPVDDGPSASDALDLLRKERDDLTEKVALLETQVANPDDANATAPAKVQRRLQKYRLLVEAVGRKLGEMPPSVKAAYGAAIAK
jgi:hypothetical protein